MVVAAASKVDKLYDSKVLKVITENDKKADFLESQFTYSASAAKSNNDMHRFLADGLDMKSVSFKICNCFLFSFSYNAENLAFYILMIHIHAIRLSSILFRPKTCRDKRTCW